MTAPLLDQSGTAGAPVDEESAAAHWPLPEREAERLRSLHGFGVLDQPGSADLDAAVRLAAYVCGTPTAAINLIDADRQWQAAAHGFEPGEIGREVSMCAVTVTGTDVVHAADSRKDARFATNPYVTGDLADIRSYASAPLVTRDGFSIGTVCVFDDQVRALDDVQLGLLRDVADQVMALFELRRLSAALARAAARDPLTGLANRRSVEQAIASAIARAERGLGTPSVVVVDLDGFKAVNDQFGHAAGDAVLRAVAARLTRTARTVDTVGRVGGDEFVVLLEHTGGPGATAALARLRDALAQGFADDDSTPDGVSASLGITTYRPGDRTATLLARADAEMYAAKSRRP